MILLVLTVVGWALSGGGLGMLISAARRRDVPHSKAKLGIGLAVVSVLCAGALLAMSLRAKPSWEKAQAAWDSGDPKAQVLARRQLLSLTYQLIHNRAPSSYTLYSVRAELWGRLKPAHLARLDATQRALLKSYALKQIELCASGDKKFKDQAMKQSGERWRTTDCLRHVSDLSVLIGDAAPIHKYYLGELSKDLANATSVRSVLLSASTWARNAPKDLQADAAITGAFDHQLAAQRAKATGEVAQLKALDEALDKLKTNSKTLAPYAPSLKSRAATLGAERDGLANQPGVGRALAFAAYKLQKTHPRAIAVGAQTIAFFDAKFLNAPVFLRLKPEASDTTNGTSTILKSGPLEKTSLATRTVAGALVAPSLEAKISKVGQGMPLAIQAVMGTTKNAAGKQVVRDTTARPDKANISAKVNMGWATAGDFPLDEQMSALAWLADYAGVDGHLDAKVTKELKAKGYSGARLTTWRTNNRTYAREHYANHGFYNGVVTGYVLRTATTPSYRSSSTYRSRYAPSRSSYRSSPSTYRSSSSSRSSSPSYRSSSSSYRSRYSSSSSRSSSRSGGYRSGK